MRYLGSRDRGRRGVTKTDEPRQGSRRAWSQQVRDEAGRRRSERPQPLWPRALGFVLIGIAVLAAVWAEYPIPRPVQAVVSDEDECVLMAIDALSPVGGQEDVPSSFAWATAVPPPFCVVLYDVGYREIGRLEAIDGYLLPCPQAWRDQLASGGVFHWQVFGRGDPAPTRSATEAFQIR